MKVLIKYLKNWRMYIPFLFFYLELVFHLYMKLDMSYAVVFLLLSFAGGMICAGILFFLPEKPARIAGIILSVGFLQRYSSAVLSDIQRSGNGGGKSSDRLRFSRCTVFVGS